MNASQDKVQGILQMLLEESIPLVQKGIFNSEQLRATMTERQKQENNMLKSTFKQSDYLKAIEYQYTLERIRRHRISEQAKTNPLFKKQSKTDFIIVKRILRLWDRTMHKYKYNMELWKQYFAFCVAIESKKHFYKALSSAFRIMPTQSQLIRIGVQYEIQYGKNLWKARKIMIKGLKMNEKNQELWCDMLRFQLYFLKTIYNRQAKLQGEEESLKFIKPEEEQDLDNVFDGQEDKKLQGFNIQKHDEVMLLVIQECLNKFQEHEMKIKMGFKLREIVSNTLNQEKRNIGLSNIIKRLLNTVDEGLKTVSLKNNIEQPKQNTYNTVPKSSSSLNQKLEYARSVLYAQNNKVAQFLIQDLNKLFSPFLTKPNILSELLSPLFSSESAKSQSTVELLVNYFQKSALFRHYTLPSNLLSMLIMKILPSQKFQDQTLMSYIKRQINSLRPQDLKNSPLLLQKVIAFNKTQGNLKNNGDIYRKLSLLCRNEPEIVERCAHLIHN